LLYFSDADEEPMPKMIDQLSWEEIKTTITIATKELL
jgi:hypothetical protein